MRSRSTAVGAIERSHDDPTIPDPPDLHGLLKDLAPADMLDADSIQKALEGFRQSESELKALARSLDLSLPAGRSA